MRYYSYKFSELSELSFNMFWKLLHCIEPILAEEIEIALVEDLAKRTGELDSVQEMKEYSMYDILPEKLPEEVEQGILNNNKIMFDKARNI